MKSQVREIELPATLSPPSFLKQLKLPGKTNLRRRSGRIPPIVVSPSWKEKNMWVCTGIVATKEKKGWVHFVGVGGCGLSGLAMLALKQGYEVTGSDIVWSSYMNGLQEAGARLFIGHSASNLRKHNDLCLPDAVVMSSAVHQDNEEILYAKLVGLPVFKREHWLKRLTDNYNLIAVSGSHGKSTTASMLAYVLSAMGEDLTALVGAHVPQFGGGNILYGHGEKFVLEADEYDGCFLGLCPNIAVVTNVDWEHVDIYKDEEAVKSIFRMFLKQIRDGGHLILCGDSGGARSLLGNGDKDSDSLEIRPTTELLSSSYKVTTYGFSSSNEWHASEVSANFNGGSDYKLGHRGSTLAEISLQIPGTHNVLNSLAVVATMSALSDDYRQFYKSINDVKYYLGQFKGVSRRFERIGSINACHIYDDYAHHPTEVRAVLQAARQRFQYEDILVVFQPHSYSRVAALKLEFASAFSDVQQVIITEIYSARERNLWNSSGRDLANSIIGPRSEFVPNLVDVIDKLVLQISKSPDHEIVILTLGAGDVTTVGRKLLHELQQRSVS